MSHRKNPPSIPPRVQEKMLGATSSVEGVFVDFMTPILSNIGGEKTRKAPIKLHQLISGNEASVAFNLGGDRHVHFTLTMAAED